MASSVSPLRYPGGKSRLLPLVADILKSNGLERGHYIEPYAGGSGLALSLLFGGHVDQLHINDIDKGVWAIWKSILTNTSNFCELIQSTPVNVEEWRRQKAIFEEANSDCLTLGFAAFFLNRTNRSGIIKSGGVIGGMEQAGVYKIDCRFNKQNLIKRIERIARYGKRIHLTNQDALGLLRSLQGKLPQRSFFCIDPPYYRKGASLYTNFFIAQDHVALRDAVLEMRYAWIITYDKCDEIQRLYSSHRRLDLKINYSAHVKRVETEILFPSKGLKLPRSIRDDQI